MSHSGSCQGSGFSPTNMTYFVVIPLIYGTAYFNISGS